ncbi:hypothetical protein HMH01_13560 [Halovulum dunhuangense]|uniref:Uncharacterized protein n=1 Tax=Halovulum dunhuangense TaxID=1505036 RepID=A0A849L5C5_9RHOB|nr:hypothetical protein [Halovulum dunhuangense]NNU81463.1 hypothetical protein [Halovulum dunhuangense]
MASTFLGIPIDVINALTGVVTAVAAAGAAGFAYVGLKTWRQEMIGRRKAELAEDLIAGFYEARDIFMSARSPGALGSEYDEIDLGAVEGHDYEEILKTFYLPVSRINHSRETLASLHARRYRARVLFGSDIDEAFAILRSVEAGIISSSNLLRRLVLAATQSGQDPLKNERFREYEERLFYAGENDDAIKSELDQAVQKVEELCSPAIR